MIVDMFAHLGSEERSSSSFWEGFAKIGAALSGSSTEKVRSRFPDLWDPSGERLIEQMDQAGIDKVVITACDLGMGERMAEPKVGIQEHDELVAQAVKAHPDRFIGFCGIDPRRRGALEFVERAVKEWGMKGISLHTGAGLPANDKVLYPAYEKALELGVPVTIHTGAVIYPMRSKYCNPVYVDDVAVDFPDLTIILPRAGLLSWWEAVSVATTKANVYLGLAGWQPRARRGSIEFYITLRAILNSVGSFRVLFASDWPWLSLVMSQPEWVKAFRALPESVASMGIQFSEREINNILGDNAVRLLGLA